MYTVKPNLNVAFRFQSLQPRLDSSNKTVDRKFCLFNRVTREVAQRGIANHRIQQTKLQRRPILHDDLEMPPRKHRKYKAATGEPDEISGTKRFGLGCQ